MGHKEFGNLLIRDSSLHFFVAESPLFAETSHPLLKLHLDFLGLDQQRA
jgi:hypothetical protein